MSLSSFSNISKRKFVMLGLIFIILWGINLISNIKNNTGVDTVEVHFSGLSASELGNIEVYRVAPNSGQKQLLKMNENNIFFEQKYYFKQILIKGDNTVFRQISTIEISIGNRKFLFSGEELTQEWGQIDEGDNYTIYGSPERVKGKSSLVAPFKNIINWPGDFKIALWSLLELILVVAIFITILLGIKVFNKRKLNVESALKIGSYALILLFSLFLITARGTGDVKYFLGWMSKSYEFGLIDGFREITDNYPPISYMLLALFKQISVLLNVDSFIIFKLSLLLFLIITAASFYYFTRDLLLTALLYLFLTLNPMGLGYIDIYIAPFLIGALFFLYRKQYSLFSIAFSLCCLIKYQPVILAPFFLIYIMNIDNLRDFKKVDYKTIFLKIGIPAVLLLLSMILIFKIEFYYSFKRALSHQYLSANALNFNWILQFFINLYNRFSLKPLSTYALFYPRILFYGMFFALLISFFKREKSFENLLLYIIVGYFTYFMFNIGVHENHLFLLSILGAVMFFLNKEHKYLFVVLSVISNINLFCFYGVTGQTGVVRGDLGDFVCLLFSLINFLFYIFLLSKIFYIRKNSN